MVIHQLGKMTLPLANQHRLSIIYDELSKQRKFVY